jgi:spore germination cell wall hydrolase CwlJ-like protein
MLLASAFLCLALNVYHESRSEPVAGQLAVAMTTMNRAEGDQKNVCEVVMAPKQFSWTNRLVQRRKTNWKIANRALPRDEKAWRMARAVAYVTLKGKVADFTHGATYYHTTAVHPTWDRGMRIVYASGNHIFYKQS